MEICKMINMKDLIKKQGDMIRKETGMKINEASDKIQVHGVGSYDYKSLKKKVQKMSADLLKSAKREEWKKSSKNGIRAFAEMWEALQKYEEKKK